jgi:hypothetical protein
MFLFLHFCRNTHGFGTAQEVIAMIYVKVELKHLRLQGVCWTNVLQIVFKNRFDHNHGFGRAHKK